MAWYGKLRCGGVGYGLLRRGEDCSGEARKGTVGYGEVRRVGAVPGKAGNGPACSGEVWPGTPMNALLSVKQAAEYLGIGKDLVYRLVSLDEVPYYRIGSRIRFQESDLDLWLKHQKRGPACFRDSAKMVIESKRLH